MKTSSPPAPVAPAGNKFLWAAIAVLGAAVIALGISLLSTKTPEPAAQALAVPGSTEAATTASVAGQGPDTKENASAPPPKQPPKTAPAGNRSTAVVRAPEHGVPAPVAAVPAVAVASSPPALEPARAVCANCATVMSVTAVEREGAASGAGAVAGGVLGALVGNQFGGGDGKTAATILGAIGGGMAGNTVEKKMKRDVVYRVQLHMDDGSTRTLEQTSPASVGARVRVDGSTLQPLAPAN